ncbi:TIGR03085 family metal-binding protein [Mangrovihabitans endophyticus]|uniref:TIGR03085 family protein n=1 Tax=Mangrovihabitans endophyticus TaxID=1751298 RepID=A0A8J3BUD3_9ACTN|nr:TIGR03085 family metal-binding protein [Mangrovihabitans endophyticus]GGK70878.1 TIGR03085 family protein [Mangrovihabitans endophyticus]
MTAYARRERSGLADLLLETGPDAPTLCAGWRTRDLAAHLVVRERRPDAAIGMLVPPLAGHGEHVRQALADRAYPDLIELVRNPPWWSPLSNPLTDELANAMEFFIHHEDVRRAGTAWAPRVLDEGQQKALWGAVRMIGRFALRRAGVPLLVRAPGHGEVRIGDGEPHATLSGEPGELVLFASGRQRAARVDIDGPEDLAERLQDADFGM